MRPGMCSGIHKCRAGCPLYTAIEASPVLHEHKLLCVQGALPVALAAIIIGRDVLLVTGACVDRCRRVYLSRLHTLRIYASRSSGHPCHALCGYLGGIIITFEVK